MQLDVDIAPTNLTLGHVKRAYARVDDEFLDEHAVLVPPNQRLGELDTLEGLIAVVCAYMASTPCLLWLMYPRLAVTPFPSVHQESEEQKGELEFISTGYIPHHIPRSRSPYGRFVGGVP